MGMATKLKFSVAIGNIYSPMATQMTKFPGLIEGLTWATDASLRATLSKARRQYPRRTHQLIKVYTLKN